MFDSGVEMRQVRLELANGELVCIGRYVRRSRLDTRETLTRLQEWNLSLIHISEPTRRS